MHTQSYSLYLTPINSLSLSPQCFSLSLSLCRQSPRTREPRNQRHDRLTDFILLDTVFTENQMRWKEGAGQNNEENREKRFSVPLSWALSVGCNSHVSTSSYRTWIWGDRYMFRNKREIFLWSCTFDPTASATAPVGHANKAHPWAFELSVKKEEGVKARWDSAGFFFLNKYAFCFFFLVKQP